MCVCVENIIQRPSFRKDVLILGRDTLYPSPNLIPGQLKSFWDTWRCFKTESCESCSKPNAQNY